MPLYQFEFIDDPLISLVSYVKYQELTEDHIMLAYPYSYLVFDYGGCLVTDQKGNKFDLIRAYFKPPRPYYFQYTKQADTHFMIFRMSPSSYWRLTGRDASSAQYELLSPEMILPDDSWEEIYFAGESPEKLKDIGLKMADLLRSQLSIRPATPVDEVTAHIMYSEGVMAIPDLLREFGFSQSTLLRHFKRYIGMTPSMFLRVVRFNAILNKINGEVPFQEIIHQYDFYDFSHMTKDFLQFANTTPRAYLGDRFELIREIFLKVRPD